MLIAASRKEKVEDRVAVAEAAGLKARVMDVESYATQEAFRLIAPSLPANGRDQNIALVDIGAHVTPLLRAAQQPDPILPRPGVRRQSADAGHPARLQPVARGSGVGEARTRDCRRTTTPTCCSRSWRSLALEVTRALQFFFTSTSYNQVDQIVLAGGCALLPGLDELVAKRAGVATVVANPFAAMQTSDRIRPRQLAQEAPMLMIAAGLAMRSFE